MSPLPEPADWLIWTLIGATLVVVLAVAAVVALVRVLRGQRPEPPSADDMAEDQAGIDSVRARLQRVHRVAILADAEPCPHVIGR